MSNDATRCGFVAIIGRPNVGKSTLLNRLLGQKLSITSRKPQTTRHQLLGIKTDGRNQVLYVDTPGIHGGERKAINRYMNRSAKSTVRDVDVVVLVNDRGQWTRDDEVVADVLTNSTVQLIIAINKIDLLKDKQQLLPKLASLQEKFPKAQLVPLSAENGDNVERLESLVEAMLPEGPFYYPGDQLTDRSERFLVSEIVREKMMRRLGDELPYAVTVQVDRFESAGDVTHIDTTIFVERSGQKAILIGKGGDTLKKIVSDARCDMEKMVDNKVMLNVWVKMKSGWSDDERALKSLGYDE
ncbi:MAG: GTPase Era [Pseudomonadales bacterium]